MKTKNSVINRFESPYPLICELKVKEFNGNGTLVNERDSTVADLCAAAEKNDCVVITAEEYKALVSFRDEYLAAKEKDNNNISLEEERQKLLQEEQEREIISIYYNK